jgi:hypothetical protein
MLSYFPYKGTKYDPGSSASKKGYCRLLQCSVWNRLVLTSQSH